MKKLFYSFVLISGLIGSSHSSAMDQEKMAMKKRRVKKELPKKKRTKKELEDSTLQELVQEVRKIEQDMDDQEARLILVKQLEDIKQFMEAPVAFQTESAYFKPNNGYVIPDRKEIYYFGLLRRAKDEQGCEDYQMLRLLKKKDKQHVPCFISQDTLEKNELFMRITTLRERNRILYVLQKEATSEEVFIRKQMDDSAKIENKEPSLL